MKRCKQSRHAPRTRIARTCPPNRLAPNLHRTSVDWGRYRRLADNGARGAFSMLASNGERPPSAPILLSSDAFEERVRLDAWREELMLRVMRVDVDVPDK